MQVYIATEDERLRHALSLLLPSGYTPCEDPSAPLVIADADSADRQAVENASILISRSPIPTKGAVLLLRPFLHDALSDALKEAQADAERGLTPTEKKLLSVLERSHGTPVSRDTLMKEVWGEDGTDSLLNLYIHYLREKLEGDGKRRIYAVRGKGYLYQC